MTPPPASDRVRRLLGRASIRSVVLYAAIALAALIAIVVLGREVEQHMSAIEAWIGGLGPPAVVAFIVLFVVATSVMVPDTLLCVVAGALFSLAWGFAAVLAGAVLAAALQYAVSRRLLRARIERALAARPSLQAIQGAVRHDELRLQFLLRLTPLSPALTSYLLGAGGVRLGGFLLACAGLVPGLFLEVYLGHAGRHIASMAGGPEPDVRLHDTVVIGGLLVGIAVVIVVSRLARKAVMDEVARAGTGEATPATLRSRDHRGDQTD